MVPSVGPSATQRLRDNRLGPFFSDPPTHIRLHWQGSGVHKSEAAKAKVLLGLKKMQSVPVALSARPCACPTLRVRGLSRTAAPLPLGFIQRHHEGSHKLWDSSREVVPECGIGFALRNFGGVSLAHGVLLLCTLWPARGLEVALMCIPFLTCLYLDMSSMVPEQPRLHALIPSSGGRTRIVLMGRLVCKSSALCVCNVSFISKGWG